MKKRAIHKEFYMEIKNSYNRFLSIFAIVALGVAFFSGVRSSAPDMQLTADQYYDERQVMDIRILGTLGMTDEDVDAIAAIKGVETVEPGNYIDVLCDTEESQSVIHLMSQTASLNQVDIQEGRLPENDGECLVDPFFIRDTGYKVGDTVTFKSGTDEDLSDTLVNDTYTIVGVGSSPLYISFERGSTAIGDGVIDSFAMVTPDSFKQEAYTQLFLTIEGDGLVTFTEEYETAVEAVMDRLEGIEEERCAARYDAVLSKANETLEDARQELADAKAEADRELADAKTELEDGESALEDAKAELDSGYSKLENGRQALGSQERQLASAKATAASGWAQLSEAKQKLNDGEAEYARGKAEFDTRKAQFDAAREQFEATYPQALETLKSQQEAFDTSGAMEQLPGLKEAAARLQSLVDAGMATDEQAQTLSGLQAQISQIESSSAALEEAWKELNGRKAEFDQAKAQIEAAWQQLEQSRQELDGGWAEVSANESKLAAGQGEITSGESAIESAKNQLAQAENQLSEGRQEITENEQKLQDGWNEYNEAKSEAEDKIAEAEKKIADGEADTAKIEMPKWYVQDRSSMESYSGYEQNGERMVAIGKVFPLLFFLVAALISLTTMTRMVEEQRTQIGTLKALGYGKASIAAKYIWYAVLATLGGSVVGVLIGEKVLPMVIIYAYKIMYPYMPGIRAPYNLYYGLMATGAAIACTLLATAFACYRTLMDRPAQLMRPAAPKQGKRVFLERIGFLWRPLSFTQKSTLRNLFRYKKRFLMTVFGIGGCMALLIVGFGLQDSIFNIGILQYDEIQAYDAMVLVNEDSSATEKESLVRQINEDGRIDGHLDVYQTSTDIVSGKVKKNVYLFVPESQDELEKFVHFRDRRSKEAYTLNDDGIILTEQMARFLDVKAGDTVTIMDGDTKEIPVTVTAVAENYMYHYAYMTPALYEKLYGESPDYNMILFDSVGKEGDAERDIGEDLLSNKAALNVTYTRSFEERLDDMLGSLNIVVVVLIVSAGMLAFVVLYNLNNINITERRRELATLKVLGFFDREVSAYVFRENVWLTGIGSVVGVVLGKILHGFVITTVEIDICMFGRNVDFSSFVYSILLTFGFSLFVNFVMYFKLKKIDMVDSLKSIE